MDAKQPTDHAAERAGAAGIGAPLDGAPTAPHAPAGGGSGITHLANRQTIEKMGRPSGGEDTVHLALNVYWRDDYEGLMHRLEQAQTTAQTCRGLAKLERGGQEFTVRRAGIKTGQGRGRYFRFVLVHRDSGVVLKLTDEAQAPDQTPNVLAELGSVFLLSRDGLGSAWAELKNILEALGGYVLWDKVSRVDMCADFPGWRMEPFRDLIIDRNFAVTRARSRTLYLEHGRVCGVTLGASGLISLRIYDKAYEVQVKKPDPVKQALLEDLRWGGPVESAVRVEYQVRRAAIKGIGIHTVREYLRMRGDLAGYLSSDWFRIADEEPDRENKNTQRAGVHPMWAEVQGGFASWAGQAVQEIRRDRVRVPKDPIRLVKQAKGCLLAALADLGEEPPASLGELVAKAGECLAWNFERAGEIDSLRRFEQKRLERGSRGS